MTLDAMYWVWLHSRSKGTGRHCLLAVANKAPGANCVAAVSTAEFIQWSNAAKSSVVAAVDKLLESGELKIVRPASGSRAATYQMPLAVNFKRPQHNTLGPETGPMEHNSWSGNRTPSEPSWSGNRTETEEPLGPETGPYGYGNRTPMGPETGPHYQYPVPKPVVESWETAQPAVRTDPIPDVVRPLVDGMSHAGLSVRWPFKGTQWFEIHALMKRSGTQALIDYALAAAAGSRTPVLSAKYFLGGWHELPPLPDPGSDIVPIGRPQLRAVNGHQPPQPRPSTTDQRVAEGLALAARLRAIEEGQQ
ncbi:hypothetical protein ACFZDG_18285 [Kitasatospora xanthocidica]|uniref:hypothetical protein n=1 Tax=Kitasatospora xanthocidica TaxID=83382 RepID=UPI0036EC7073